MTAGGLSEDLGIQKILILLHFRNPRQHNKLLARRHPNMGRLFRHVESSLKSPKALFP
jgi:hypothetical protein